jgi:hypothetical protein
LKVTIHLCLLKRPRMRGVKPPFLPYPSFLKESMVAIIVIKRQIWRGFVRSRCSCKPNRQVSSPSEGWPHAAREPKFGHHMKMAHVLYETHAVCYLALKCRAQLYRPVAHNLEAPAWGSNPGGSKIPLLLHGDQADFWEGEKEVR